MTLSKLTALIAQGRGQGHRAQYKPFQLVGKSDASPTSNMGHLAYLEQYRHQHPRAVAEWNTFVFLRWLGAWDVREAFPVWPYEHPHPEVGLSGKDPKAVAPSLVQVANGEIDVGRYVGSDLNYIATLDSLVTWKTKDGFKLLAVENKPEDLLEQSGPMSRMKQRLELTRRYCQQAEISWVLCHAEHFPPDLAKNLDALRPTATGRAISHNLASASYRQLLELSATKKGSGLPLNELARTISVSQRLEERQASRLLHLALWRQDIDHDLSKPLRLWEPRIPGGRSVRNAAVTALLEAAQ